MLLLKEKYKEFCKIEIDIPIYSQPWWLDIVCGENNWDVILIEIKNQIVASFPYFINIETRFKFRQIEMPVLTQKLGLYIKYPTNQTYASKLIFEKDIIKQLITKLPKHDSFTVNFDFRYTNWLPFYWHGFQQTTRYTYLIDFTTEINIMDLFNRNKIRNLKKGIENLSIKHNLYSREFIEFYQSCLSKSNEKLDYPVDLFCELCDKSIENKQGATIYAVDENEIIHGAIFYIWDNSSIIELVSAFDPDYKSIGSSTYLVYYLMSEASKQKKIFDFEGSMIEKVEDSFRQFGAQQKQYFRISKINSRRYKIFSLLSELRNEFRN